jgi:hypothetical protein
MKIVKSSTEKNWREGLTIEYGSFRELAELFMDDLQNSSTISEKP